MFVVLPLVPVIACTHPGTGTVNLLRTLSSGRQRCSAGRIHGAIAQGQIPLCYKSGVKEGGMGALKFSQSSAQKNPKQPSQQYASVANCVAFE